MTKIDELQKYREILVKKQRELTKARHEGLPCLRLEPTPDAMDLTRMAAERELAVREINTGTDILRLIAEAQEKIEQGTFGICTDCDQEIPPKRLKAVPWAKFCIQCQENFEKEQRGENAGFGHEDLVYNPA